jgi:Dehydrogenases with different specificities (related to short-chain alcohol dehydrogenases)
MMTDKVLETFAAGILSSRTAVVTGGSGGLGRVVCLVLAQTGANVIVGYHRDAQAAHEVCEETRPFGAHAVSLPVDVAQSESVDRFMEQADDAMGPVDILVNCAGTWPEANILGNCRTRSGTGHWP